MDEMGKPVFDSGIEDLRVDGRAIQRLWWENEKVLFSLCGPAVVDVYAKTSSDPIGRGLFTGQTDSPRRPVTDRLIPLTAQGDTCGAVAWVANNDPADRTVLIRPWTFNSFTNDRAKCGYGARCGFAVYPRYGDGRMVDSVFGNIPGEAVRLRGQLMFVALPGEPALAMWLRAPGPVYFPGDPEAEKLRHLFIGLAMAALPGEKAFFRGENYLAAYAEPTGSRAKKAALAVIYDTRRFREFVESDQDGGARVLYFEYEPTKQYEVPMRLLVGWDGDGLTSGSQWEAHVKAQAEAFGAAQETRVARRAARSAGQIMMK